MNDDDVIIVDTGGTMFDVEHDSLRHGQVHPRYLDRPAVDPGRYSAWPRWIFAALVLGVGPLHGSTPAACFESGPAAPGSVPGPSRYGRGGTEATVTDAAVALGYIDPDRFLGGRMKLDKDAAVAAIAPTTRAASERQWRMRRRRSSSSPARR